MPYLLIYSVPNLQGLREPKVYPRRVGAQAILHTGQDAGLSQGTITHTNTPDNLEMLSSLQHMSSDWGKKKQENPEETLMQRKIMQTPHTWWRQNANPQTLEL